MAFNLGFDFGSTTSVLSYYNKQSKSLQTINLDGGLPYIPSKLSYDKSLDKVKFGTSARADIGKSNAVVYEAFKTFLNNEVTEDIVARRGYDEEHTPEMIAKEFIDLVLRRVMQDHNETQIDHLCIGVPYNWGKSVRTVRSSNSIKQAVGTKRLTNILSQLAYIKNFEVVFEPEAASALFAYNYSYKKSTEKEKKNFNGTILIIDYGGGSLDVTLSSVKTLESDKMEIRLIDGDGIGENSNGMVGSAGIRYIESLIACAAKESGIPSNILTDPDCKASMEKLRTAVEIALRDNKDTITEVFENGNTRNKSSMEILKTYKLCEELELKKSKNERYEFDISYNQLYEVYEEVISHDLDNIIDIILARNSEINVNSDDFKIGLVGGFSNFYFVRKQIWDKFRINSKDPRVAGLLTNPEEQEKAISLGAALLANDRITLCKTSDFAIGVFTMEEINGHKCVAVPHFAIEYRQEIQYNTVYYSMMLGGKQEQVILSPSGHIDQLIIMREKDDRHIMVLSPNPDQGRLLRNVIRFKAQVGFSISEDNIISVHIREVEDIGFGRFKTRELPPIPLSDFDSLFTNYTVPAGEDNPFNEWLTMVENGECPRR